METLLIFLANAIASGAIGHFVSKGLGKIDKELPLLFEQSKDIKTIEKLVIEKGIETQVIEFANSTFGNSIVLPSLTSESVTNKDKTELFLNLIRVGMELSFRLKMDLILPSSFISEKSFTLFKSNEKGIPNYKDTGVSINIGSHLDFDNRLFIIPVDSDETKKNVWNEYLEKFSELREESEDYLKINKTSNFITKNMEDCQVEKITASSCYFLNGGLVGTNKYKQLKMSGDMRSGIKSKCAYWFGAIKEMTNGMKEIMNRQVLPLSELEKIREAYSHIQDILDTRIG